MHFILLDSRFRGNDGKGAMNYGSINNDGRGEKNKLVRPGFADMSLRSNLALLFYNR